MNWIILSILFIGYTLTAQEQINKITPTTLDSSNIKSTFKWLNLKDWNRFNQGTITLEYKSPIYKFNQGMYDPARVMPKDPFKLDYRSGSYYVPTMVRDELTHIMNRPKDSAFMPVLGVAFLAAQLAAKYLIVQQKIQITGENIINTKESNNILRCLWQKNPQTLSQLFEMQEIRQKYTMQILEEKINSLKDNKLIKQKLIDDDEIQYFPAITKLEFIDIAEKAIVNTNNSEIERKKLEEIMDNLKTTDY